MAGGLMSDKAETRALIHRSGSGSSPTQSVAGVTAKETLEIDLVQLLERGDVSLNVPVYAGDVISVPERVQRFYYVLGDVIRGGAFEIRKGESITLTKAIASAGGLLQTAKAGKSAVIRQTGSGSTEQIPINVSKLLKGQLEDMVLSENDVVFVPGSTTKTVGRGVMNSIGGILASLVYVGARY